VTEKYREFKIPVRKREFHIPSETLTCAGICRCKIHSVRKYMSPDKLTPLSIIIAFAMEVAAT
jgi:hypothetical protein